MKFPLSWPALRNLVTRRVVAFLCLLLLLVPVLAKAVSPLVLRLSFSWECFFFSALSFGLGALVYTLRCPKIIKEYHNFKAFKEVDCPGDLLQEYAEDIGLWRKEQYLVEESVGVESERSTFLKLYHLALKSNGIGRLLCSGFLYLGGFLMLIVLGQNIWWVVSNMMNRFGIL